MDKWRGGSSFCFYSCYWGRSPRRRVEPLLPSRAAWKQGSSKPVWQMLPTPPPLPSGAGVGWGESREGRRWERKELPPPQVQRRPRLFSALGALLDVTGFLGDHAQPPPPSPGLPPGLLGAGGGGGCSFCTVIYHCHRIMILLAAPY